MSLTTVLVLAFIIAMVAAFGFAAYSARRSLLVLVVGIPLAVVAAGLAYYAFVESKSMPWGLGYSAAAVGFVVVAAANWLAPKHPKQ